MSIYVYEKKKRTGFSKIINPVLRYFFIIFFSFPLQGVRHQEHLHIFHVR